MSLLLISTDGTETGATAANKINNAITATIIGQYQKIVSTK